MPPAREPPALPSSFLPSLWSVIGPPPPRPCPQFPVFSSPPALWVPSKVRARCVHLRPPLTRLDGQLSGGRGPGARLAPGSPLAFPGPSVRPPRLPDPPPAPRRTLEGQMPRGTRCRFPTAAPVVGRPAALPGLGQPGGAGGGGGRGPWTGQQRSLPLQSCSKWGRGTSGWKVKKYCLKQLALCRKR